jgi:hypothetical protein
MNGGRRPPFISNFLVTFDVFLNKMVWDKNMAREIKSKTNHFRSVAISAIRKIISIQIPDIAADVVSN